MTTVSDCDGCLHDAGDRCMSGSCSPQYAPDVAREQAIRFTYPDEKILRHACSAEEAASEAMKRLSVTGALNTQVGGDHYRKLKIQPIEYIHTNNIPFAEGSIIKYVTRWRDKNGIKDLEKAKHFIELLIELESRK